MINFDRTFCIRQTTLTKVTEDIQVLRERLDEVAREVVTRDVARTAIAVIDRAILEHELDGKEVDIRRPVGRAHWRWMDARDENKGQPIRYQSYDLRARLILIPHQGAIWGMHEIPVGTPGYFEEIMSLPGMENHNPDMLGEGTMIADIRSLMTKRVETWKHLLGGDLDRDPALVGIEAVLHSGLVPRPDREKILAACPSHEDRVRAQASQRVHYNIGWSPERKEAAFDAECRKIAELLPEATIDLLLEGPYADKPATPTP